VLGDKAAFEILFRDNWDHVYSFALLMTKSAEAADDIGQEVFLALLTDRAKLANVTNLKGYLYSIVKYKVLNRLRHKKVEQAYRDYLATRTPVSGSSADAGIYSRDIQEIVAKAIAQLPPQQRTAFELSRVQGLTHEQISAAMGVSKKTVKDYIVRALAFVKKALQQYGHPLPLAAYIIIS